MGVVSINSIKSNMKFLGIVALVGLASANNLNSDVKAAQNLLKQNGFDQQKLADAQAKAQAKLNAGLNQAQNYASQPGIDIDFNQIFNDLNTKYGQQVEQAVSDLASQGQTLYNNNRNKANNIQNNSDVKKVQNLVQNANFQNILKQAPNAINQQINQIPNAQVKKNLKGLVKNANKQAKQTMTANGLNGNVLKKAEQEFKKNNGQAKIEALKNDILAQAKAAAAKLN